MLLYLPREIDRSRRDLLSRLRGNFSSARALDALASLCNNNTVVVTRLLKNTFNGLQLLQRFIGQRHYLEKKKTSEIISQSFHRIRISRVLRSFFYFFFIFYLIFFFVFGKFGSPITTIVSSSDLIRSDVNSQALLSYARLSN